MFIAFILGLIAGWWLKKWKFEIDAQDNIDESERRNRDYKINCIYDKICRK